MFLWLLPSLHPLSGPILAFLRVLVPHVGRSSAWGSMRPSLTLPGCTRCFSHSTAQQGSMEGAGILRLHLYQHSFSSSFPPFTIFLASAPTKQPHMNLIFLGRRVPSPSVSVQVGR